MSEENSVKTEAATGNQPAENKLSDKELNFARLRQERDREAQKAEAERQERLRLEQEIERLKSSKTEVEDDSDVDDIYAEVKKLKREVKESEKRAAEQARRLVEDERKALARYKLKADYPDFDKVVTPEIADKLVEKNPRLAEMLARIPKEDRLPLIYETVQMSGLHKKPEPPQPSAQEQINKNLRNPYYTPAAAGQGTTPMGDFSDAGKKNAYEQMRNLMRRPLGTR